MNNFIDYLKKDNIIEMLISQKKDIQVYKNFLNKIINNIEKSQNLIQNYLRSDNSNNINSDLFGSTYEKILNHKEQKALGEFYTPVSIVNYILNGIDYDYKNKIENKKLIDISCGSGSFLIQAINRLIDRYKIIYNREEITDFSLKEAKLIIQKVKRNIFGIDINPIACVLCQINIQFVLFEIFKIIRKYEKKFQFPRFNIININALSLNKKKSFDYVVGNPPYLFIRDIPKKQKKIIDSSDFRTKVGQYDYYQIFIELGIRILKHQGILGYIVPDSILVLSNRSSIRKYIYNSTKIKEIYHTGPKFDNLIVSNVILILQEERIRENRENNKIQIYYGSLKKQEINQKIIENWDYKFLINLNSMDIIILDHLNNNFPKLNDLINSNNFKILISRGVELGKKGKVIFCTKCQNYLPLPKKELKCKTCGNDLNKNLIEKIIYKNSSKGSERNLKPFIYSINRYKIKDIRYIDIEKQGINYKDLKIYENRLVIRQLSENKLISATYNKDFALTSQSFYNLKILNSDVSDFNHLYVLGIINSTLLSYYFIKSFGSYKKLFPRILIEKIKDFPIKIPKTNEERQLAKKLREEVTHMLNSPEMNDNLRLNVQKSIDLLVFKLFRIPPVNQQYIFDFMDNLN